jgi:hypothetical protein
MQVVFFAVIVNEFLEIRKKENENTPEKIRERATENKEKIKLSEIKNELDQIIKKFSDNKKALLKNERFSELVDFSNELTNKEFKKINNRINELCIEGDGSGEEVRALKADPIYRAFRLFYAHTEELLRKALIRE